MITIQWLYVMAGLMFAAFALLSAKDRSNAKRLGNAAFWGLMALSLLGGDLIGGRRDRTERRDRAERRGRTSRWRSRILDHFAH